MDLKTKEFIEKKVKEIEDTVGSGSAISALSGGVDSSACTVLAHKALGDRLKVIYIDDGLMRENEDRYVSEAFSEMGIKVEVINARSDFFSALKGITDPEDKRKAFRNKFYEVFGESVLKSEAKYLIQGTIAADISRLKAGSKPSIISWNRSVLIRKKGMVLES